MFASRILTFNKTEFLTLLATGNTGNHTIRKEYFNIGYPIGDPPTLRGSMIVEFDINFIIDNHAFFKYGSPVDIGSLNAGYINTNNKDFDFLMNFERFTTMLTKVSKTNSFDIKEFMSHRVTDKVNQIIEEMLGIEIAHFILNDKNPHSRIFEFCLNEGYTVRNNHIKKIYIPNTYTDNNLIKLISKRFTDRLTTFNPKYGFESKNVA